MLQDGLPSEIYPIVDSASVTSSHALAHNSSTPFLTGVAEASKNIDVYPSVRIDLAEETADSGLDLRPLVSPCVSADHPVASVATTGKATLGKAISSRMLPHTQKKSSTIAGKVMCKLPPSTEVVNRDIFLDSDSPSITLSANARHARRAVLPGPHFYDTDNKEVLLIIS